MKLLLLAVPFFTFNLMAQDRDISHRVNVKKVINYFKTYSTEHTKGKKKIIEFLGSDDNEAKTMNRSIQAIKSKIKTDKVYVAMQDFADLIHTESILVEYNYSYMTIPKFHLSLAKIKGNHHVQSHFETGNSFIVHTNSLTGKKNIHRLTDDGLLRSSNVTVKFLESSICDAEEDVEISLVDELKWSDKHGPIIGQLTSKIASVKEQIRDCDLERNRTKEIKEDNDKLKQELEDEFSEVQHSRLVNEA